MICFLFFCAALILGAETKNNNGAYKWSKSEIVQHSFKIPDTQKEILLCRLEDNKTTAYFRYNQQDYKLCGIGLNDSILGACTFDQENKRFFYLSKSGKLFVLGLDDEEIIIHRVFDLPIEKNAITKLHFVDKALFMSVKAAPKSAQQIYQVLFKFKACVGWYLWENVTCELSVYDPLYAPYSTDWYGLCRWAFLWNSMSLDYMVDPNAAYANGAFSNFIN